jgi:hypothetical protein
VLSCGFLLIFYIRKKFTSHIDQILENADASDALSNMQLAMVDSGLCQENFNVANKYLLQSKEKVLHDYFNTNFFFHRAFVEIQST